MSTSPVAVTFYCADQNPHRDRSLGISSYTDGLMRSLRCKPGITLHAITSRSSIVPPGAVSVTKLPFATDNAAGRLAADHVHPFFTGRDGSALWHYPKGFLPFLTRVRVPTVATVHDMILQFYADRYPDTRSRTAFAYWLHIAKRSITRADFLLTVSEFSKRAIIDFADRYKLRCPPIHVTFQGVRFEGEVPDVTPPKADYVLHLASALPHKRTRWLLKSWEELQRTGMELPELLIVGKLDAAAAAAAARMAHVKVRGLLGAEELARSIRTARALVLPSEIEGFGLPAVEAYLLGTPVAFVADTAVSEIVGADVPGAFDFDRESFAQALAEVLAMPASDITEHAQQLRQKYRWEACATRTIQAYQRLL